MNLTQWAIKWGVSADALYDLRQTMGMEGDGSIAPVSGESEAAVSVRVRLEASRKGARLYRNNVGAFKTENGAWVRYGLANESKAQNKKTKSSDLIGLKPVVITPCHIGQTLGVFVARETKPEGWTYSGTAHEQGQLNFLNIVASLGGDAAFATGEGTL